MTGPVSTLHTIGLGCVLSVTHDVVLIHPSEY